VNSGCGSRKRREERFTIAARSQAVGKALEMLPQIKPQPDWTEPPAEGGGERFEVPCGLLVVFFTLDKAGL
jgi:hypothetical protein